MYVTDDAAQTEDDGDAVNEAVGNELTVIALDAGVPDVQPLPSV